MTTVQGTYSLCGDTWVLNYTCTGPQCGVLDGFPDVTCTTASNVVTCTSGTTCDGQRFQFSSAFTHTQPGSGSVSSTDTITIPGICERIQVISDFTRSGTAISGSDLMQCTPSIAQPASCSPLASSSVISSSSASSSVPSSIPSSSVPSSVASSSFPSSSAAPSSIPSLSPSSVHPSSAVPSSAAPSSIPSSSIASSSSAPSSIPSFSPSSASPSSIPLSSIASSSSAPSSTLSSSPSSASPSSIPSSSIASSSSAPSSVPSSLPPSASPSSVAPSSAAPSIPSSSITSSSSAPSSIPSSSPSSVSPSSVASSSAAPSSIPSSLIPSSSPSSVSPSSVAPSSAAPSSIPSSLIASSSAAPSSIPSSTPSSAPPSSATSSSVSVPTVAPSSAPSSAAPSSAEPSSSEYCYEPSESSDIPSSTAEPSSTPASSSATSSDATSPSSSSITVPPRTETSTIVNTRTYTITSCKPTVTNCPVGHVTTETFTSYSTYCPDDGAQIGHPAKPTRKGPGGHPEGPGGAGGHHQVSPDVPVKGTGSTNVNEAWPAVGTGADVPGAAPTNPQIPPAPVPTPATLYGTDPLSPAGPASPSAKPVTASAGRTRPPTIPFIWCTLLLIFGFIAQGISALAHPSLQERQVPIDAIVLADKLIAQYNIRVPNSNLGESLVRRLVSIGCEKAIDDECSETTGDVTLSKSFAVDFTTACRTAITDLAIVGSEAPPLLLAVQANILCDFMLASYIGSPDLLNGVCNYPKPCTENFRTDVQNCGRCGNVCGSGVCNNSACQANSCTGQTCDTFTECGPGGSCVCASTAGGAGYCADGQTPCAALENCETTEDCVTGQVCAVGTCCSRNVCISISGECNSGFAGRSPALLLRRTFENATLGDR